MVIFDMNTYLRKKLWQYVFISLLAVFLAGCKMVELNHHESGGVLEMTCVVDSGTGEMVLRNTSKENIRVYDLNTPHGDSALAFFFYGEVSVSIMERSPVRYTVVKPSSTIGLSPGEEYRFEFDWFDGSWSLNRKSIEKYFLGNAVYQLPDGNVVCCAITGL